MKLKDLARRPQLIEIRLDDEDIIQEFGEAITFHTWDRHPMDVFLRMSTINQQDHSAMIAAVRDLVLDDTGQPILTTDEVLPTRVMMRVITRVVESLGKL